MIRPIKKEEIPECVRMIRESFQTVAAEFSLTRENAPRHSAFATDEARLERILESGFPMFGYFNEEGQIVGYYALILLQNNECELTNLCVLPGYRHLNIGAELMNHAISTARESGCTTMNIGIIEENIRLRKWYESFGAEHIGTKKFDFFPFTCGYLKKDL
jgi:ribosomal protein S18 acetylase RimI-like enzyme